METYRVVIDDNSGRRRRLSPVLASVTGALPLQGVEHDHLVLIQRGSVSRRRVAERRGRLERGSRRDFKLRRRVRTLQSAADPAAAVGGAQQGLLALAIDLSKKELTTLVETGYSKTKLKTQKRTLVQTFCLPCSCWDCQNAPTFAHEALRVVAAVVSSRLHPRQEVPREQLASAVSPAAAYDGCSVASEGTTAAVASPASCPP